MIGVEDSARAPLPITCVGLVFGRLRSENNTRTSLVTSNMYCAGRPNRILFAAFLCPFILLYGR